MSTWLIVNGHAIDLTQVYRVKFHQQTLDEPCWLYMSWRNGDAILEFEADEAVELSL